MWTDKNTESELIKGVLRHGVGVLENCLTSDDISKYLNRINSEFLDYPKPPNSINIEKWFIPNSYNELDIEEFLVMNCPPENYNRLIQEIKLYKKHNMMPLLKTMKYIVDTLRSNRVVWGVGRGSSVASYVLYLIGVHKIDSVKYNLPIEEFFKGEQNG